MIRFIFRAVMLLMVVALVITAVQAIRKPMPKLRQESPEQIAAQAREGKEIMSRAFAVGKTMARSGTLKPTAEQVDAMSRAAHAQAKNQHSHAWFKQYFESGFWEGWKSN